MRSRYRGGGIGAIGADVFSQSPANTSCPDGQHYVPDAAPAVRGLGACVPNTVSVRPLHLPTSAPAPAAPPAVFAQPTFSIGPPPAAAPAPSFDTAPAPSFTAAPAPCPALWPWWWLLVAAGAGGALGYYAQKNQKAVKRNAGRVAGQAAGRIVNRASEAAIARLVG